MEKNMKKNKSVCVCVCVCIQNKLNHQCNGHELGQTLGGLVRDREAWCATVHRVVKNWT